MISPENTLLRPTFTRRVWQRLQAGECLRLVGAEAQGRGRLVEDLRLLVPPGTGFVAVDLALFFHDYALLMQGLAAAIGSRIVPADLGEWVEAIRLHAGSWVLAFDHFEAVESPGADPLYDESFFTTLQLLALDARVSLLCVSDRAPKVSLADIEAFERSFDLELEVVTLPPLSLRRLEEEAERLLGAADFPSAELAHAAFSHPITYPFLQYLAAEASKVSAAAKQPSKPLIDKWRELFDAQQGLPPIAKKETRSWWNQLLSRIFSSE